MKTTLSLVSLSKLLLKILTELKLLQLDKNSSFMM